MPGLAIPLSTLGAYLGPPQDSQSLHQAHKEFEMDEFGFRYRANFSLLSSGSCSLRASYLQPSFRYKMGCSPSLRVGM